MIWISPERGYKGQKHLFNYLVNQSPPPLLFLPAQHWGKGKRRPVELMPNRRTHTQKKTPRPVSSVFRRRRKSSFLCKREMSGGGGDYVWWVRLSPRPFIHQQQKENTKMNEAYVSPISDDDDDSLAGSTTTKRAESHAVHLYRWAKEQHRLWMYIYTRRVGSICFFSGC